jgi:membrane-bound inhibitor of C-type lysozyme
MGESIMSSLTGKTPSATYKSLLKIDGENQEIDATPRQITDGSGNNIGLQLKIDGAAFNGFITSEGTIDVGDELVVNGDASFHSPVSIEDGVTITGNTAVTGNVTGTNLNIANWDTAYGWGDHSAEIDGDIATHTALASAHHTKYALTEDLASTEITALQNINTKTITNTQWGYLGAMGGQPLETFSESDPVFVAHQANNITAQMITDLGNLSNTNSGDQVIPTDFVSAASGGAFSDSIYVDVTNGSFNTVYGENTDSEMYDVTGGGDPPGSSNNTFIGYEAGGNGTISSSHADRNTAVGAKALSALTSGQNNIAIGKDALLLNANGNNNIAIGMSSLVANIAGFENMAIGNLALWSATGANQCVAVGNEALMLNVAEDDNVAVGSNALAKHNDGNYNTQVGSWGQYNRLQGERNTGIGGLAAYDATGGDNSVFIGFNSGRNDDVGAAVTTPEQCVSIGSEADFGTTTPTNEIVIGYDADGAGDNTVTIGNASVTNNYLTGQLSLSSYGSGTYTGTGTKSLAVDSSGNIIEEPLSSDFVSAANGGAFLDTVEIGAGSGMLRLMDCEATGFPSSGNSMEIFKNGTAGYISHYDRDTATFHPVTINAASIELMVDNQIAFEARSDYYCKMQYYGDGNKTGTATYSLAVDTQGKIIEEALPASDERIKRNIEDTDLGLDFISALRPVRFQKVNPADYPEAILEELDERPSDSDSWNHGLVAQEVKAALDSLGIESDIWNQYPNGKQMVKYEALVVPLIKAVQELSSRVIELEK